MNRREVLVGLAGVGLGAPRIAWPSSLPPGMRRVEGEYDGVLRTWYVFTPSGARERRPLVLGLHGRNQTGEAVFRRFDWARTLEDVGWCGVFPDLANDGLLADVDFLSDLLERTLDAERVDHDRVYAVGFSGGGKKAYALAAQRSDLLAAIAVCATRIGHWEYEHLWSPELNGARRVSILHLHGLEDPIIDPTSSFDPRHPEMSPVPMSHGLRMWARHDRAREVDPPRVRGLPSRVRVYPWASDDGYAVLGLVDPDLAHRWAGYANPVMVDFLRAAPRR